TGQIAANPGRQMNGEWQQALDVRNLTEVARLIARAALLRDESRGSHYRTDFPTPDDDRWLKNIYLTREHTRDSQGNDQPAIAAEVKPAVLSRLHPAQLASTATG
ncbi:MAG: hypothetical protein ACRDI2_01430, partial [Chloroflexota bacterium]